MAVRIAGGDVCPEMCFSDVDPDSWYAGFVGLARAMGLMVGRGGGIFGPDDPVTREELELVAGRLAEGAPSYRSGCPVTRGRAVEYLWKLTGGVVTGACPPMPFDDVPPGHPCFEAIAWASYRG